MRLHPSIGENYSLKNKKGKNSLMIFQKFGNMNFAYRNREFWCK